jgi:hypothetical protein
MDKGGDSGVLEFGLDFAGRQLQGPKRTMRSTVMKARICVNTNT